jgi:hypothetical protein
MPGPTGILDGLNNDQQDQLLTWLELYQSKRFSAGWQLLLKGSTSKLISLHFVASAAGST